MSSFYRLKKYLQYRLKARSKYYLHSPFIFQFYLLVLEPKDDENLKKVCSLRTQWASDQSLLPITELGTGTAQAKTISSLVSKVAVKHRYGKVLYALVSYFKPETILEIGTSIGISSAYMASAASGSKFISLEGNPAAVEKAALFHSSLGIKNARLISGDFKETLLPALTSLGKLDMAFIDGNHTYQATLSYFEACLPFTNEHSVLVFDDIYWSEGMTRAWEEIRAHPQVRVSIDIYQFGIVCFRKQNLAKEDFVLWY